MAGESQAAGYVLGHSTAGVPDHVGLADMQAENGERIDPSVHAGDHRQTPGRFGGADDSVAQGVLLISSEELLEGIGLGHGPMLPHAAASAVRMLG